MAIAKRIDDRAFHPRGRRCRSCHNLNPGPVESCAFCSSHSLFDVSLLNEILEMLIQSGAEIHFADSIPALIEVGAIAALLRY